MGTRCESGLAGGGKLFGAMAQDEDPIRVRTLFLSDLHLGTRGWIAAGPYGETFTWQESARQFFSNIETAHAEQ